MRERERSEKEQIRGAREREERMNQMRERSEKEQMREMREIERLCFCCN